MDKQRYDQRVRVFVEVRGGEADWELAGERFAAHGWPVREAAPAGEGPLGEAVEARPDSRVYEIEVRLPGIAKGADLGAARRVAKALRAARVEGYVRRADVLHRDRERLPYWRAVDTSARPRPATSWFGRRLYWTCLDRPTDRHSLVQAEAEQALRLARAGQWDVAPPTGVRVLYGGSGRAANRVSVEYEERSLGAVLLWALGTAAVLPFILAASGLVLGFCLTVFALGTAGTLRAAARLLSWWGVLGGGLFIGVFGLLMTGGLGFGPVSRRQVALSAAAALISGGLWLLGRQWRSGEWVAWAVPLAATLSLSTLVTAGSVLHTLYAAGFELDPSDLDVSPIWKVFAAAKLLELLSFALALPAWWGVARHRHHFYALPGESFSFVLWFAMTIATVTVTAYLVLAAAGQAITRTTEAAERGTDPPPFFGVQPDWTCVEPVVPADKISGEGPPLDPARPYLSFGVAGGNAVLWDAEAGEAVKVPASKVRLVPAEGADQVCRGV
ncbi:hypothetical protein AB0391_09580 [Streptomyces albidoflavus]|uniref:hypothetical protein n=1 Tax=Streptomyces albidoflavus TaxID=1886 RepID=UPI00344BECF0